MLRFAFFDLDDTLVDRRLAFPDCVAAFQARFQLADEVNAWLLAEMAQRAYREDFGRLQEEFALPIPVEELWRGYCESMAELVACAPETAAGLKRLRSAGWRLAVVTYGAADIQRAKLRRTGLMSLVDAVCISEEVGVRKPEAEIFEAAKRLLGLTGQSGGWMVGDNLQNDIVGGRAAGFRTVWVADSGASPEADHCVGTTVEAIELMLAEDSRANV